MLYRWAFLALVLVVAAAVPSSPPSALESRTLPLTVGPPPELDAHDGSIVQHGGTFWLFGTAYGCGFALGTPGTRWCGIDAFSSTDLVGWTPRGAAIEPSDLWQQRCAPPRFGCFRPHVARSPSTGEWVLWLNTYDTPAGYRVLVARSPAGPWQEAAAPSLAAGSGAAAGRGDHDVFVDSSGRGWIAYTVIEDGRPADMAVEALDPALTSGTGEVVRLGLGFVEAPSLFERDGRFFLAYSDPACPYCPAGTGLASAPSPLGPWVVMPALSRTSCDGQPADVATLGLAGGRVWLYMVDRWDPGNPNQAGARIWWEPLAFGDDGVPMPPRCVAPSPSR